MSEESERLREIEEIIKKMEKRLANQELMHVDIFKKQNELFGQAMNTLVSESSNHQKHLIEFMENRLDDKIELSIKNWLETSGLIDKEIRHQIFEKINTLRWPYSMMFKKVSDD